MRERLYVIEGKAWVRIARASKLLRTNAIGVRKLMGEGKLDRRQTRLNSRTFVVRFDDVMRLRDAAKRRGLSESSDLQRAGNRSRSS